MNSFLFFVLSVLLLHSCNNKKEEKEKTPLMTGCHTTQTDDKEWYTSGKKAPMFKGLNGIEFKVSTQNEEVQAYFNQGMMLSYGFNHAEAARSFYEASRLDSTCAMAYWGYAYVLGPNYNAAMVKENNQPAYEASRKALLLAQGCTPMEIALIKALTARYEENAPDDRGSLDLAYASAMKKVYEQFSTNPDIGALYAESLMDLHPWDLYEKKNKEPKEWTPELLSVLEHLIATHPKHPGAHHFYIHALESSATPEKALPSAQLLDTLVPGAGHLVHMPSHIYINTGDYHLGTVANLRAIEVDSLYTTACHAQGVYPLTYYPHNYHFLAATASLEGSSQLAWKAAKELQRHTATDIMDQPGWGTLQHYYTIPLYIAVKFAMWDTIFSQPKPDATLLYPQAIWHYARGMACLGTNKLADAQKELEQLQKIAKNKSLQQITVWDINTTADLVQIAEKVLSGEIAAVQKQFDRAVSLLQEAVALEDNFNYNEPPDWFFSVRHHLGAVLLSAGKVDEAEKVYYEDLEKWKSNGWALIGLYNVYQSKEKEREAKTVKADFEKAWQYADINLVSSSSIPH